MKACFFDIDGTLAYGNHIFESNIRALKALKEAGVKTFICTGRPYYYAYDMFTNLVDGYICSNGRYVKIDQEVIVDHPIDLSTIMWVNQLAKKYNFGVYYMGLNHGFAYQVPKTYLDFVNKNYGFEYLLTSDVQEKVYMFDVCYPQSIQLNTIQELVKDKIVLNDHHDGHSADATILGFSKGDGIKAVLEKFQIRNEHAYAFGDGTNDLCMFAAVKNKIAMGNACEALKKEATYITASFDQDGIYQSLLNLGLIK